MHAGNSCEMIILVGYCCLDGGISRSGSDSSGYYSDRTIVILTVVQ